MSDNRRLEYILKGHNIEFKYVEKDGRNILFGKDVGEWNGTAIVCWINVTDMSELNLKTWLKMGRVAI